MIAVISYPPLGPIHLGPIQLSVHGLFIALGIFAGAWLASRHLARAGGDVDKYQSVVSWALVGALLGAATSPPRPPCWTAPAGQR